MENSAPGKRNHEALQRRPFTELAQRSKSSVDNDHNWLVTLSDVLSLLLMFFVMFFMMSKTAERTVSAEPAVPVNPQAPGVVETVTAPSDREKIVDEMSSGIRKLNLEEDVTVREAGQEIVITLKERVTFREGEAETLGSSGPLLDNVARIIQRYPSFLVEIEGHTDNIPIKTRLYPSNWELSVARSTSVLKYFITHHGIDPSRLSVKGNADQKPVAFNDTPENRAKNRRVEIRLKSEAS